jgi:hypothetical protein
MQIILMNTLIFVNSDLDKCRGNIIRALPKLESQGLASI